MTARRAAATKPARTTADTRELDAGCVTRGRGGRLTDRPGRSRSLRKVSATEEDDGRRIGPERPHLSFRNASRMDRVEEPGARQRCLDAASALAPDRRLAPVAHTQQMDVGSHGPRDEPAGDAGEPRVTADAEGTAEPKGRCLVDEEAASAQDDEIAPRKPRARVLEESREQQARGAAAGR